MARGVYSPILNVVPNIWLSFLNCSRPKIAAPPPLFDMPLYIGKAFENVVSTGGCMERF